MLTALEFAVRLYFAAFWLLAALLMLPFAVLAMFFVALGQLVSRSPAGLYLPDSPVLAGGSSPSGLQSPDQSPEGASYGYCLPGTARQSAGQWIPESSRHPREDDTAPRIVRAEWPRELSDRR